MGVDRKSGRRRFAREMDIAALRWSPGFSRF